MNAVEEFGEIGAYKGDRPRINFVTPDLMIREFREKEKIKGQGDEQPVCSGGAR